MIDTIILRVHNLVKYDSMIRRLDLNNNPGYTSETAKVDKQEVHRLRSMGYTEPKEIIDILKINRTGEFLVKTKVGKQMNSSNHYAFTYFVNWTKNYVEFNFSVPKYRFGSNVIMFVEHLHDRDFKYYECSTLAHNLKRTPKFLMSFIKFFLKHEFTIDPIDPLDVEINRIDVCFNQVFKTKTDALKYLEYQKRLKKKYAKDEEGVMREYATSLMYVTKRYSAKIYHKGSEYKNNDSKEHAKINKEKGFDYFKIEQFQMFSDRVLRYELTIRNTYLNYLFKQKLFRKDCKFFKIDYKSYVRVGNVMQKNDRISKKAGTLPDDEKEIFLKQNPYEKIDKNDRRTYKYVSRLMEQRTYFMLETDKGADRYNEESVTYSCNQAKFSGHLVYLCLKKLVSFINEFQIKELPDEEKVIRLIDLKNSTGRSKIPKAEMIQFYSLLAKYGSFKEAGKYSGYSRATIYRYKSRFKEIGITETTIKPLDTYTLPEAHVDFKEYHSLMIYQYNLLRGIRIC